jgi:tight adherence protein B
MQNPILVVLIFLATVLAVEGIYLLVADRRRSGRGRVQQRLQELSGRVRTRELSGLDEEASILRGLQTSQHSFAETALRLLPNRESLELLLYRAGTPMSPARFLSWSALLAVGGWIAASILLKDAAFGTLGALLGVAPRLAMGTAAARRLRDFGTQFPEALELLTRALRAGHSLGSGFQLVGEEMPEPISIEFGLVAEEMKFGLDARSALVNLSQRVNNRDIPFFITAVLIQRETGGNLAELLENLGNLLRERAKFFGKVQAMTSQGRMTANILAAWPPITVGMVTLTGSNYLDPLFTTKQGYLAILACAVLIVLGWAVARKLAEVDV